MGKKLKEKFEISLQLGDETYEAKGATIEEALKNLPRPDKIMTKGVLTVKHGNALRIEMMFPTRLKRLFYNKLFQQIQAKNLTIGLKPVKL